MAPFSFFLNGANIEVHSLTRESQDKLIMTNLIKKKQFDIEREYLIRNLLTKEFKHKPINSNLFSNFDHFNKKSEIDNKLISIERNYYANLFFSSFKNEDDKISYLANYNYDLFNKLLEFKMRPINSSQLDDIIKKTEYALIKYDNLYTGDEKLHLDCSNDFINYQFNSFLV